MEKIVLITGGARSGKSRKAESYVGRFPPPWIYIATAEARDEEMAERIRSHRERRSPRWKTVEEPLQLVQALRETEDAGGVRLVDCLTLWLSNLLEAGSSLEDERNKLKSYLRETTHPVVLVTNEVGTGIVPLSPLARRFRDEAGRLNQEIAQIADEVILMVSGLPIPLKSRGEPLHEI